MFTETEPVKVAIWSDVEALRLSEGGSRLTDMVGTGPTAEASGRQTSAANDRSSKARIDRILAFGGFKPFGSIR